MVTQDTNLQLMYYSQANAGLPWLCFTALEAGSTFAMVRNNGTAVPAVLELSRDKGKSWSTWDKSQVILERKGDRAWLRGDNISLGNSTTVWTSFVMTGRIAASGSVYSLTSGDDCCRPTQRSNASNLFLYLFANCTALETPPELPAIYGSSPDSALHINCYRYMFVGCSNLKRAPKLPSLKVGSAAYSYMFKGCTSLTTPPSLPADTLDGGNVYTYMFYGCTSLRSAPALPALFTTGSCYSYMFSNCSSLEEPPELPALWLEDNCYQGMFAGCIRLRHAPALPATVLADGCYGYMFDRCSSLEEPPELPATFLANSCYSYMFRYCASLRNAPALPATELVYSCYLYMFNYCTSLSTPPDLPFTVAVTSSCNNMFNGCIKLSTLPELHVIYAGTASFNYMFYLCTSAAFQGVFNIPVTVLTAVNSSSIYQYMLSQNYNLAGVELALKDASNMSATGLSNMLDNAPALTDITVHFKEWPTGMGLNWVRNVATYGTFHCPRDLPVEFGTNRIPTGWTVEQFDEPDPEPPAPEPLPELPAGYRVVEYLENVSDGSGRFLQYIDTGKSEPAQGAFGFSVTFSSSVAKQRRCLISNSPCANKKNQCIATLELNTNDNAVFLFGSISAADYAYLAFSAETVYTIDTSIENNVITTYVRNQYGPIGAYKFRPSVGFQQMEDAGSWSLFRDWSTTTTTFKQVRIHRAIVREGETAVRDLVPCVRESDGKPGFYDLCGSISGTTGTPFYVNADTTANAPDFNYGQGLVPAEYRKVEYLESSGTQYIQITDGEVDNTWGIEAEFSMTSVHDQYPAGASQLTNNRILFWGAFNNTWRYGFGTAGTPITTPSYQFSQYAVGLSNFHYGMVNYMDSGTVAFADNPPQPLSGDVEFTNVGFYLFKSRSAGAQPITARFKYARISVGSQMRYELHPVVRRSDSKPGMYDTVTRQFYVNAGTGEFTWGELQ